MVITYTGTCIPARVAVVMTVETKRLQVVWRRLQTAFFTACLLHSVCKQPEDAFFTFSHSIGSSSSSTAGDVGARHGACAIEANGGSASAVLW